MNLTESLVIALVNLKTTGWKTKVSYSGDKLFSHFIIGYNSRFEDIVSYPLPIDYWDKVTSTEIDKEPYNTFRKSPNPEVVIR